MTECKYCGHEWPGHSSNCIDDTDIVADPLGIENTAYIPRCNYCGHDLPWHASTCIHA